uniref:Recombinase domain-containing protein n=1 Tax=Heterorhabditis bacteriophora TaxID=37862 RepID=A0A1I7WYF8_HETBA
MARYYEWISGEVKERKASTSLVAVFNEYGVKRGYDRTKLATIRSCTETNNNTGSGYFTRAITGSSTLSVP